MYKNIYMLDQKIENYLSNHSLSARDLAKANTQLLSLISDGKENEAHYLLLKLKDKSHPEIVNKEGDTALLLCIHYSMEKLALAILDTNKANVTHIDKHKNSVLILAIKKNLESVANKIIDRYSEYNINYVDAHNDTALSVSLRLGMYSVAKKLIKNPICDMEFIDGHGDTPLIIAVNMLGNFHYSMP